MTKIVGIAIEDPSLSPELPLPASLDNNSESLDIKSSVELESIHNAINDQFILHNIYGFGIEKIPEPHIGFNRGNMDKSIKELIERLKDRPDIARACLEFIEKEITRPKYAKLSAELTEARFEREREQRRQKQARYRQRLRGVEAIKPS